MISALDKWMGNLKGRLSLLAIIAGTLFANLSGASVASAAMLGSTLAPEMERRGYKKPMVLGPIMAGGGLAAMIPPRVLASSWVRSARFRLASYCRDLYSRGIACYRLCHLYSYPVPDPAPFSTCL